MITERTIGQVVKSETVEQSAETERDPSRELLKLNELKTSVQGTRSYLDELEHNLSKREKHSNKLGKKMNRNDSAVSTTLAANNHDELEEKKLLNERIKQLESQLTSQHDELKQMRDSFELVKIDRKRLKCEKYELLNQIKDLYKVIESKENEIRDFLKQYERKSKEMSQAVKKLIDSKAEIEKEKNGIQAQLVQLLDEKNEFKLIIESKNAQINKLKKQYFDVKLLIKSQPIGYAASDSKESDCGYSSSKSRDTLSSSVIESSSTSSSTSSSSSTVNDKLNRTATQLQTTSDSKQQMVNLKKLKKEERSLKCKSNDSYIYMKHQQNSTFAAPRSQNNDLMATSSSSASPCTKSKYKLKSDSDQIEPYKKPASVSNNFNEFDCDLNKVLDSEEFIDLDDEDDEVQDESRCEHNLDDALNKTRRTTESSMKESVSSDSSQIINIQVAQSTSTSNRTSNNISPTSSSSLSSSSCDSFKENQRVRATEPPVPKQTVVKAQMPPPLPPLPPPPPPPAPKAPSLVFNQSLIQSVCERDDELAFNRTALCDTSVNMSSYSIKQPLSMSMSHQNHAANQSSIITRSSKLLNSIIRLSTISSTSSNMGLNTLNSTSNGKVSNKWIQSVDKLVSASSSTQLLFTDEQQQQQTKGLFSNVEVDKWTPQMIRQWLENIGMMPLHVKSAMKHINSTRALMAMSDAELERAFQINNNLHKRKIRLAIDDELKASMSRDEKSRKFPKLAELNTQWLCHVWLKDIGLTQLQSIFKLNLIDGRVLASLQRKDLEKYLGISKRSIQTSLLLGVDLLRRCDFDIDTLAKMRSQSTGQESVTYWTNENFVNWIKLMNLEVNRNEEISFKLTMFSNSFLSLFCFFKPFLKHLNESGLHGAFVMDSSFTVDTLYQCLKVPDDAHFIQLKKIVDDELKMLKKGKSLGQKSGSQFMRSVGYSTMKNEQQQQQRRSTFTFRGSLGRALGKKIKRDISSPLVDDDTLKRIESKHKIVDMRLAATTGQVVNCATNAVGLAV